MSAVRRARNIAQGEYAVSGDPQDVITTLLGSCVGVCLHDPVNHVGGMNHILLPENSSRNSTSASLGVNAMELLINALIKHGAQRDALQAKVFGGSCMVKGLSSIGAQNAAFVSNFLASEGIPVVGGSTGGDEGRRIQFWPYSGAARQKMLGAAVMPEQALNPTIAKPPLMNGVELF